MYPASTRDVPMGRSQAFRATATYRRHLLFIPLVVSGILGLRAAPQARAEVTSRHVGNAAVSLSAGGPASMPESAQAPSPQCGAFSVVWPGVLLPDGHTTALTIPPPPKGVPVFIPVT